MCSLCSIFSANATLFWLSSHMSLWNAASFNFAILANLLVAFFYPFGSGAGGESFVFVVTKFTLLKQLHITCAIGMHRGS
jgi:hypothetical protein